MALKQSKTLQYGEYCSTRGIYEECYHIKRKWPLSWFTSYIYCTNWIYGNAKEFNGNMWYMQLRTQYFISVPRHGMRSSTMGHRGFIKGPIDELCYMVNVLTDLENYYYCALLEGVFAFFCSGSNSITLLVLSFITVMQKWYLTNDFGIMK